MEEFVHSLANILGVEDWVDGDYTVFEDHAIKIETMTVEQYDALPEFAGY